MDDAKRIEDPMSSPTIWIIASPYEGEELRSELAAAGLRAMVVAGASALAEPEPGMSPDACVVALRPDRGAELTGTVTALRAGACRGGQPVLVVGDATLARDGAAGDLRAGNDALVIRPLEPGVLVAKVRALLASRAPGREGFDIGPTLGRIDTGRLQLAASPPGPEVRAEPAPPDLRPKGGALRETSHGDGGAGVGEEEGIRELDLDGRGQPVPLAAEGELGRVDVAELLARLHRRAFTGHLELRRDQVEKRIAFDGGRPVFASSSAPHDRLGDLLHREGRLTWAQYQHCREAMELTGRRLGAILVDEGLVGPRELLALVRRHVSEIIYSVFSWQDGVYRLASDEPAPNERIRVDLHPWALLLEGLRRKYGLDRLRELLAPTFDVVVQMHAPDEVVEVFGFQAEERDQVASLLAPRTLRAFVEEGPLDELRASQVAYALLVTGLIVSEVELPPRTGSARTVDPLRAQTTMVERQRIRNKHAQVCEGDYFSILGLAVDATAYEIAQAYERTRHEFAPSSFPSDVLEEYQRQVEEIVEVVEEAHAVLSDETLRHAYRESLTS
ncbi:MAG: DUF4388 domain-containing protein [Deltaproteobacteria bacterium]|nr:DUF4388 domain-containing protein [Deltaproteobacteria bacterium]